MPEMEYKIAPTEWKATGDKGEYEGYYSVIGNEDDGKDVVEPGAFVKTIGERGKRVKVFYMHDWTKLIGPPPSVLREDQHGLYAAGHFTLNSFWGKEAWELMKDGALTEGSFGYEPIKFDFDDNGVRHLRELKLFEISPVPLGMNALTEIRAVKAAMLRELKAAIPPKETPMADEGTAWDAAAVLREVEGAQKLRLIHAWVDADGDPEVKASYKLPHHLADGRVVWRGVAASGAALMGARGGVAIPDSDAPGVKRHLALHYRQFEKTPPWEESAGLDTYVEALEAITRELKEGRVLSSASKEKVEGAISAMQAAMEALNALLEAAVPPKMADVAALARRVRLAGQLLQVGIS
jgi:HK97 family phage prohead protease